MKIIGFPDEKDNKGDISDINNIPDFGIKFKYYLCIYCFFNFLICLFFEKIIAKCLTKRWLSKQQEKNKNQLKNNETKLKLNIINDIKIYEKVNY